MENNVSLFIIHTIFIMRKIISLLIVLATPALLHAQAPYACVTKGATLEYANYNEADKLQGYTRQDIKEVSDLSGGNYELRIENSKVKKPGKKKAGKNPYLTVNEIRQGCVHAFPMDSDGMVNVIEGGESFLLPNTLAVGYQLPIGDVRLDTGGVSSVATVTENEVIGREEVTTPAGTFKCYVLKQTMSSSLMGISGMVSTTKSWYCRGVGIVKSETMMSNRLMHREVLVTFKTKAK